MDCEFVRRTRIENRVTSNTFWHLVNAYEIDDISLGQIVNAPIKVLLDWANNNVPKSALTKLKDHLKLNDCVTK